MNRQAANAAKTRQGLVDQTGLRDPYDGRSLGYTNLRTHDDVITET